MGASGTITVERLSGDLVTVAQCIVIDVESFPYPSLPFDLGHRDAASHVWVARDESCRVLGFLAAVARRELEIVGLAVERTERRGGVGRALVRAFLDSGPALPVMLHVSTTNVAAIRLYLTESFVVRRHLVGYYARGVYPGGGDAFEMVWEGGAAA
jgi:ribosomal protein S18 acetylase RimI-like enzyme